MNSLLSALLLVLTPDVLDALTRLFATASKVKDADPKGFLAGLFDPSKAEENAAAVISAGLDAGLVAVDLEVVKLALSTAEATRVGETFERFPNGADGP